MVEMKTCLAMLLPHVSFRLAVPEEQICPDAQLTIGMGRGLPCFVTKMEEKEEFACASTTAGSEFSMARSRSLSESTMATDCTAAPSELTDPSDLAESAPRICKAMI